MDWLRSEDLKEEKNVTAPVVIIAVHALSRCQERRGVPLVMQRMNPEHFAPDHLVAADIFLREMPDEEDQNLGLAGWGQSIAITWRSHVQFPIPAQRSALNFLLA